MSKLEELEKAVEELSAEELARFRAWFAELDARLWDAQIASDSEAGKLDGVVAEASEDYRSDKVRDL
jgi:hypothetical protein